jgi:hypothetical protein
MIFSEVKKSGLYDRTSEIRVGIVNDHGHILEDERLNDPKIKILFCNESSEYERPTLYHMRITCDQDIDNTSYWYLHTKGLRHFGTKSENSVIDWIKFLLYCNITQWKLALEMLISYDTYGCNAIHKQHYSGNFWWVNSKHLKDLPVKIGDYYTGREDWICIKNDKMFNIFSSGLQGFGHYTNLYPESNYILPKDFNIHAYKYSNKKLKELNYEELISHYLLYGKNENINYKLPEGFNTDIYKRSDDMTNFSDQEII